MKAIKIGIIIMAVGLAIIAIGLILCLQNNCQ
jgi:hypothetical protein